MRKIDAQQIQKAKQAMALYEVTYEEANEIKSEILEASGPVEAANRFSEANRDRPVVVICVVRQ